MQRVWQTPDGALRVIGSLHRTAVARPTSTIAAGLGLVLLAGLGLPRLEIRTGGHALVPRNRAEIRFDQHIRDDFGIHDQIVVLIESGGSTGIFNTHTLELVADLTADLAGIEGTGRADILSLATEQSDRVRTGTLDFKPFLEPIPRTDAQLQRLRDDLRQIDLYTGTLVSHDGRSTAIFVEVREGLDRTRLVRRIDRIVAARAGGPERISVVGAPVAEALLGAHILDDLGVPEAWIGRAVSRGSLPSGVPGTLAELRVLVARSVGLLPLAIIVMGLVFLIFFRSLVAMLLPLGEVAACLVFVFGMMGWLGVPVYLTTAVMPIILTAVGTADEIHIFHRYREHLRGAPRDADHAALLDATMSEMWRPILRTSVTTAIGFLSFALSAIDAVRAFGVFTAVGVVFCLLWSLTVVPACLAVAPPGWLVRPRRAGGSLPDRAVRPAPQRFARLVIRHRVPVAVLAVIVVAVSLPGLRKLFVQDSWIDGFAPDSEFRRSTEALNRGFLGSHVLLVTVDTAGRPLQGRLKADAVRHFEVVLPREATGAAQELIGQWIRIGVASPGGRARRPASRIDWGDPRSIVAATGDGAQVIVRVDRRGGSLRFLAGLTGGERVEYEIAPRRLLSPETHELLCALGDFIRERRERGVGGVLGPCEYLTTTHYLSRGRDEKARRIPHHRDGIKKLWERYERVRGPQRLREAIDPQQARTVLAVYVKNANFVSTSKLLEEIRAYEWVHLAGHGIVLGFAGDVAVSQTLIDAVVTTQVRSLLLSLVGILVVTALLGRSLRLGLYCVLPCTLAVLANYALMGALRVPLGVATSMFAGMTLGIGVDYAIHLVERWRLAAARGLAGDDAVLDAVAATGPAILVDALAVALGFGVLMLSQVPANARLGGLVVSSVLGCFTVTLVLLPALLSFWRPPRAAEDAP